MILARYLTGQFLPPFAFGLSIFSGVLLLDKLFDLIDLLINKGVSLITSLQIFILFFPTILSLSVPMSLLLACLLTFGRLSEDNEILALRASGLSFRQILWPPIVLALGISLFLVPFNTHITPAAMERFRGLYHKIATADPLIQFESRQFLTLQNARLYADRVSKDRSNLSGVWVFRFFPDRTERVHAETGSAHVGPKGLTLRLSQGTILRSPQDPAGEFAHIRFQNYRVFIPFTDGSNPRARAWREYSTADLKKEISSRKKRFLPAEELRAEMHLRYAMAFAPLALALVGVPLGLTLERGGRGVGFGAAIGVLFVYYILLIFGMNVAEKGKSPAWISLWLANVTATATGLFFLWRRLRR